VAGNGPPTDRACRSPGACRAPNLAVTGSGGEWPLLAAAATGRRTPTLASVQAVQESESTQSVRQCKSDHATGAPQTPASTAHTQLTMGRHAGAVCPTGCCTSQRADRLQARLSPGSRSDLSGTPPQSRSVILAFREVRRMLQACYESSNRIEAAPTSGLTTPPRCHSDDADPHPTWASVKVRDQYHRCPFHCKSAPTIQLIP
jgi:hypothetical protein